MRYDRGLPWHRTWLCDGTNLRVAIIMSAHSTLIISLHLVPSLRLPHKEAKHCWLLQVKGWSHVLGANASIPRKPCRAGLPRPRRKEGNDDGMVMSGAGRRSWRLRVSPILQPLRFLHASQVEIVAAYPKLRGPS